MPFLKCTGLSGLTFPRLRTPFRSPGQKIEKLKCHFFLCGIRRGKQLERGPRLDGVIAETGPTLQGSVSYDGWDFYLSFLSCSLSSKCVKVNSSDPTKSLIS